MYISVFGYEDYRLGMFVFYRASLAFKTHLQALQCWKKFNAKAPFLIYSRTAV